MEPHDLSCIYVSLPNGSQGNWSHLGSIWLKQRRGGGKAEVVRSQEMGPWGSESQALAAHRDRLCHDPSPLGGSSTHGPAFFFRCACV